jgi:hypothetical protein
MKIDQFETILHFVEASAEAISKSNQVNAPAIRYMATIIPLKELGNELPCWTVATK